MCGSWCWNGDINLSHLKKYSFPGESSRYIAKNEWVRNEPLMFQTTEIAFSVYQLNMTARAGEMGLSPFFFFDVASHKNYFTYFYFLVHPHSNCLTSLSSKSNLIYSRGKCHLGSELWRYQIAWTFIRHLLCSKDIMSLCTSLQFKLTKDLWGGRY